MQSIHKYTKCVESSLPCGGGLGVGIQGVSLESGDKKRLPQKQSEKMKRNALARANEILISSFARGQPCPANL